MSPPEVLSLVWDLGFCCFVNFQCVPGERVMVSFSKRDFFLLTENGLLIYFPLFPLSKKWEECKEETGQSAFLLSCIINKYLVFLMSWSMLLFEIVGTRVPVTPGQRMHSKENEIAQSEAIMNLMWGFLSCGLQLPWQSACISPH